MKSNLQTTSCLLEHAYVCGSQLVKPARHQAEQGDSMPRQGYGPVTRSSNALGASELHGCFTAKSRAASGKRKEEENKVGFAVWLDSMLGSVSSFVTTQQSEGKIAAALSHGTARPQRDHCTTVSRPTEGSRRVEQPLET